MKTIYKYAVPRAGTISISSRYSIINLLMQENVLWMYAIVDTESSPVNLYVESINTGQEISSWMNKNSYVGTVQSSTGIVWHVFARTSK